MKLYANPMACSLAPHVALIETQQEFDLVWVDGDTKRTEHGEDYFGIAPKGQYPALQFDDGSLLTEMAAILQWIADQRPGAGLAPPRHAAERYRLQEWLHYIGSEIHARIFWLYFNAHKQTEVPADGLRRVLLRDLQPRLDHLERALQDREHLLGADYGVADIYLLPMLNWSMHAKVELPRWPRLATYHRRLLERPAVRQALQLERQKYAIAQARRAA